MKKLIILTSAITLLTVSASAEYAIDRILNSSAGKIKEQRTVGSLKETKAKTQKILTDNYFKTIACVRDATDEVAIIMCIQQKK